MKPAKGETVEARAKRLDKKSRPLRDAVDAGIRSVVRTGYSSYFELNLKAWVWNVYANPNNLVCVEVAESGDGAQFIFQNGALKTFYHVATVADVKAVFGLIGLR